MTSYEAIYPGADDNLMPKYYNSVGYSLPVESLGMATDPRTANILGEINIKSNPGGKHLEVGAVQAGVFESIPEQHLDEARRQLKLIGVTPSVHAPIVEASGVGEGGFKEENRLGAELQLQSAVLRSHKLDPKGNISVTTHSTGQLPEMTSYIKDKEGKQVLQTMYVIDPESGRMGPIPGISEKRYFPEGGKFTGKPFEFDEKKELKKINEDQWSEQLSGINRYADFGEENLERLKREFPEDVYTKLGKLNIDEIKDESDREKAKQIQRALNHSQIYLRDSYRNMKGLFDKAFSNATSEDKTKLKKFAEEIAPQVKNGIENDPESVTKLREVVEKGLRVLSTIKTPEVWKPLNEFVIDKSAQTFANVAETAYKKFGQTAPMLNIENPPAGGGLSRAEDLKKLVETSRQKLAENLANKGMSKGQAKEVAEKMIGATWDVGHINMLRKKGYSEKDIIKQTEIIAPFVKHVHLSDNFGLDHTELPMGMGNVPTKEIMEKLKKQGFKGKEIIEAGNWWQYFAEHGGGSPFRPSIEAFDSPVYGMTMSPYWSQAGAYGSYYSGHGPVNPAIHHRVYGAGFENLPLELGGQMPGDQSRFSGSPNQ